MPPRRLSHTAPGSCDQYAAKIADPGREHEDLNQQFTRSYIKQQVDYVRALGDEVVDAAAAAYPAAAGLVYASRHEPRRVLPPARGAAVSQWTGLRFTSARRAQRRRARSTAARAAWRALHAAPRQRARATRRRATSSSSSTTAAPTAPGRPSSELAARNPSVTAIRLSRNFGQHAAITAGLAEAHGPLDRGDGLRPPGSARGVPRLYSKALEGYDVVFGRRRSCHDSRWYRRLAVPRSISGCSTASCRRASMARTATSG